MGVPKFFRYISERYPCLSEFVNEYEIPEFDNLYLDMNGIIHVCSHPDDRNIHFRITEEKIFQDIFHYIEVLFRMIKPKKLFFLAIDGVAPRAKMNQQRCRRFQTARCTKLLEAKAQSEGQSLPDEVRFDSNCITPGTSFMVRLHDQLKYFVTTKISSDQLWQNCTIILSGHNTPGEGEHKIMDYIRYMRAQPDYDPNTRHCLYGLDADLIMLGLCTHDPHFSLLREEVRFGKKANCERKNVPEQATFFLLHLSLMREYLALEFQSLKDKLSFGFDIEKIIDDWILMGFLIGNDFIPHLPGMHITNGALPVLYNTYMEVLPTLDGYINEAGALNLERFEKFLQQLAQVDVQNFAEVYDDLKWLEAKTGKRFNNVDSKLSNDGDSTKLINGNNRSLSALIQATDEYVNANAPKDQSSTIDEMCDFDADAEPSSDVEDDDGDDEDDDEDDTFNMEFRQHKTNYYMSKLEYSDVTPEVLRSQAEGYVRAIQWNLNYYYNGVCSWSWFYPHHYAPYISDIKGFANLNLDFELGEPFKPYEQLLAVLPSGSKSLLPEPFQALMTDDDSPIKHFYPEDFLTDLNGKRQSWEAVVLIPFIEEETLLTAMATVYDQLSEEEKVRNGHGPMSLYRYTCEDLGPYAAPNYFPQVKSNHAKQQAISIESIRVAREDLVKGAHPRMKFDVYYPGFPTMQHVQFTAKLEKARVKVFEQPSRNENMILQILHEEKELESVADGLLGKVVHVNWPHLTEAMIVAISDEKRCLHHAENNGSKWLEIQHTANGFNWEMENSKTIERYKCRMGIDVGNCSVLVHVRALTGKKYTFSQQGRISYDRQWCNTISYVPLETVVLNITQYESDHVLYKDLSQVFPIGSQCFLLGHPNYGTMGKVIKDEKALQKGRISFLAIVSEEPNITLNTVTQAGHKVTYTPLHIACPKLGVSKCLMARITGTVFVNCECPNDNTTEPDCDSSSRSKSVNIGLNLKINKQNKEVPGYTRKEGTVWLYSDRTVEIVRSYMKAFPDLFVRLNSLLHLNNFTCNQLFPEGDGSSKLKEIRQWIKKQPFESIERRVCGSRGLDSEAIPKVEEIVDKHNQMKLPVKQVVMLVKPHVLFKPEIQTGRILPDPTTRFHLCDRIVNVRNGHAVPLGYKGTIIAINKEQNDEETTFDVVFDETFAGGLSLGCSPNRGYRMPGAALINISHGKRICEQKSNKKGNYPKFESSTSNGYPTTTIDNNNPLCSSASAHLQNYNYYRPPNWMMYYNEQGGGGPPSIGFPNYNKYSGALPSGAGAAAAGAAAATRKVLVQPAPSAHLRPNATTAAPLRSTTFSNARYHHNTAQSYYNQNFPPPPSNSQQFYRSVPPPVKYHPNTFVPYSPQHTKKPQAPNPLHPSSYKPISNTYNNFMPNFQTEDASSTQAIETQLKKLLNIQNTDKKSNTMSSSEHNSNIKSVPFSVQDLFRKTSPSTATIPSNTKTSNVGIGSNNLHPILPAPPANWRNKSLQSGSSGSNSGQQLATGEEFIKNTDKNRNKKGIPFVPLQAVRKQRKRTVSAPTSTTTSTPSANSRNIAVAPPTTAIAVEIGTVNTSKQIINLKKSQTITSDSNEKKNVVHQTIDKDHVVAPKKTTPPKRKPCERKIRIAANFQKSMVP